MKAYMKKRRQSDPIGAMLARARDRASKSRIPFHLDRFDLVLPVKCPVLGISLTPGQCRGPGSPSLDRVWPDLGYVPGNVRVISDRANRLKSNHSAQDLSELAARGHRSLRGDYGKVLSYVEREALLSEVRKRAAQGGRLGEEWDKVARFLDRTFRRMSDDCAEE
jgi:hypothetical protein